VAGSYVKATIVDSKEATAAAVLHKVDNLQVVAYRGFLRIKVEG
jgi:hypothetical protein